MEQLKVMLVFGTRPETIKLAPLITELKKDEFFQVKLVATAQHRELLDQMIDQFKIKLDYDLDLMEEGQSLAYLTKACLSQLSKILRLEAPDLVLVHGDTTTAVSAALTAFYEGLTLGHVEAGLRSCDKFEPFPEEVNRRLIAQLSDFHFVPSFFEKDNLLAENIKPEQIFITGNTVIDALIQTLDDDINLNDYLPQLNDEKKLILVTIHRRESFGEPLKEICKALKELATKEVQIFFLVHPNPKIKNFVSYFLADKENIHLVKPLSYRIFVNLMARSFLILTDSGGLQEEAPALGKPVLVLRDKTERKTALQAGVIKLIGREKDEIIKAVNKLLTDEVAYRNMKKSISPYGNGKTSQKIVAIVKKELM